MLQKVALLFFTLICSFPASAEPWLSTRYAQNCAGCHAPGRKNLPPVDRRCTLSCQGCHVSPSGGGMRSPYGKWNEERWLTSFRSSFFKIKKAPAIYPKQTYAKIPWAKAKARRKKGKRAKKHGLETTNEVYPDEQLYDRRDGGEHKQSESRAEFLHQVPVIDPYYDLERSKIDGGADIRWQIVQKQTKTKTLNTTTNATTEAKRDLWDQWLMTIDLGLRYRPFYKGTHIVYEGRHMARPGYAGGNKRTDYVLSSMFKRSFYIMQDDLPYNTYVMAGYYRPMFGVTSPDHTSLSQIIQAQAITGSSQPYTMIFEAFSFGGSPNVPFANIHYLNKRFSAESGTPDDSFQGFVTNLGGRFVTLGLNVNYFYWLSENDGLNAINNKITERLQMHALSGGIQFMGLTSNLEYLILSKDTPDRDFRSGYVITWDNYYRVWREVYGTFSYAIANTGIDLGPGSAWQARFGARGFLLPGVDISLQYGLSAINQEVSKTTTSPNDTTVGEVLGQLHFYM